MKKTSFCIMILIILGSFKMESFAQQYFVKGYIITNDKDTVKGYINDYNWVITPKIIQFTKNIGGEIVNYRAGEIASFSTITGNYFQSAIVEVDKSVFRVYNETYEPLIEMDTVFLKVLIKGEIDLYYLRISDNRKQYFVKKENSEIIWLEYKKYLEEERFGFGNISRKVKVSRKYKGQLMYLMSDCELMKDNIAKIKFVEKELKQLVLSYNNRSKKDCVRQEALNAYLITNNNDTLFWNMKNNYSNETPEVIQIPHYSGKDLQFAPGQIKSVYIPIGNYYRSAVVEFDVYILEKDKKLNKPMIVVDTIYLKEIIKGHMSLYSYKPRNKNEIFFVKKENTDFIGLNYKEYMLQDGIKQTRFKRDYIGQLRYLMSDCEKFKDAISKLNYKKEPLSKLVLKYNSNFSKNMIENKDDKVNFVPQKEIKLRIK